MNFDQNKKWTENNWEKSEKNYEDIVKKIALEFEISFEKTKELINSESIQSLSKLKKEFSHLDNSRLQKLFEKITEAKAVEKQNINEFLENIIDGIVATEFIKTYLPKEHLSYLLHYFFMYMKQISGYQSLLWR